MKTVRKPNVFSICQVACIPSLDDENLIKTNVLRVNSPFYINNQEGDVSQSDEETVVYVPACKPENLGDSSFCRDHGLRYPYIIGGMANGITSPEIVEEMGNNGMLAFFGSGGLPLSTVEKAIKRVAVSMLRKPFGFNLVHNANEPEQEAQLVALYIANGITLIEAAAFLDLTVPLVQYRLHGIHKNSKGEIVTPHKIVAKVSRVEIASKFFSPPPEKMVRELIQKGTITQEQADLAAFIPMAQDLTAEADSGGHTDNRPAVALLPTMIALRDRFQTKYGYQQKLRVGAAGGLATPSSVAAMFAMGAAYVVTGSINQACLESGSSDLVRELLGKAAQSDVTMAPSADMFEMGVKVQVLKRGTMFAMRAGKLYETYRKYDGLESIPEKERLILEKSILCATFEQVWEQTKMFFSKRDPVQIKRGESSSKHKMALVFRWYLGQSSTWANSGDPDRKMDYQIWCGPAIGAFNEWVKGSFLEDIKNRRVVTLAKNLMYGAAVSLRLTTLRYQGVKLSSETMSLPPQKPEYLEEYLN